MPDRELPEHLRAKLSEELTSGAPLVSPLPSQARYATAGWRAAPRTPWRLVVAGLSAVGLVVITALAGPPQARAWIGQSVGNIAHSVENGGRSSEPSPSAPASPLTESPEASPTLHPNETPSTEPRESPEPSRSPQQHESPEPEDSPRPSPSGGGASPGPSPSPSGD